MTAKLKKIKYGARSTSTLNRVATNARATDAKAQPYLRIADRFGAAKSRLEASSRGENTQFPLPVSRLRNALHAAPRSPHAAFESHRQIGLGVSSPLLTYCDRTS